MKDLFAKVAGAKTMLAAAILVTAALVPVTAQEMGSPMVRVENQAITDSKVMIAEVFSKGPGWLVVHIQADGKPGPVIGYAAVRDGRNTKVVVSIDAAKATPSLFAMLHTDAGSIGVYEFPGPDVPVKVDNAIVMSAFQAGESRIVRVDMKARRFEFAPNVIRVKAGTEVELHIVSEDATHGIAIKELGINEKLQPGKEVVVRFTPTKAGRYPFICSVFCGPGHRGMAGELIVN